MNVVIRAGGVGVRLWPVSRRTSPKQFQRLIGDQSLFRDAFDRARGCVDDARDIFVSCGVEQVETVRALVPELGEHNVVCEPFSRNTGPAMCLEAAVLETRCDEDMVVCSMPSDDHIGQVDVFVAAMKSAENYIKNHDGVLVTPCVPATDVDTGFGYVEPGEVLHQDEACGFFSVSEWVDKPTVDRCRMLVDSGSSFVHMGMYVYRLGAMIEMWERMHPNVLHVCRLVARAAAGAHEQYKRIPAASIESMITCHEPRVAMQVIPDLHWSDVGKWHVVKRLLQTRVGDNVVRGQVHTHATDDCLIFARDDKMTVIVGLHNVIVVDTPDALLVSHADRSHEIKEVLQSVEERYT